MMSPRSARESPFGDIRGERVKQIKLKSSLNWHVTLYTVPNDTMGVSEPDIYTP